MTCLPSSRGLLASSFILLASIFFVLAALVAFLNSPFWVVVANLLKEQFDR